MKRRGAAFLAALLLLSGVNSSGKLYLKGEIGVRGTALIISAAVPSLTTCAAACLSSPDCLGFNWKSSGRFCDTLSSLRTVEIDADSVIYVEEIVRTSLPLSFSCATCMFPTLPGRADWELDCPGGGVAVGVASVTALTDLDYLLCSQLPGVTINFPDGGIISGDRICSQVIGGRPFPVTALWCDQQFFVHPTSFAYQCREIISGQKIDLNRCVVPSASQGAIPGVQGTGHQLLLCPPHMVAAGIYWDPNASFLKLTCCLVY